MDKVERDLAEVHADLKDLREKGLPELRASLGVRDRQMDRRLRVRDWIIGALCLVVAASVVVIVRLGIYAVCVTNRSNALNGPGNRRTSLLIGGAFGAALAPPHLTDEVRNADLDFLDKARTRYGGIPARSVLVKEGDKEIVIFVNAVKAEDEQHKYAAASADHPVCTLWSL